MGIFGQHYFIEPNIPHFKDLLLLNQTYLMKDLGMLVFNQNLTNYSIIAKASNFKLPKCKNLFQLDFPFKIKSSKPIKL